MFGLPGIDELGIFAKDASVDETEEGPECHVADQLLQDKLVHTPSPLDQDPGEGAEAGGVGNIGCVRDRHYSLKSSSALQWSTLIRSIEILLSTFCHFNHFSSKVFRTKLDFQTPTVHRMQLDILHSCAVS